MLKRLATFLTTGIRRPQKRSIFACCSFCTKKPDSDKDPKAIKEIEEFLAKIEHLNLDENPNPEHLFKPSNPEQALSIRLVEAKTPEEILIIYKEEIQRKLSCDERALLFYFLVKTEAFKKGCHVPGL
jgi:hypothetical protein